MGTARERIGPLADPEEFSLALEAWFRRDGKDYPWRRVTDPYAILVSEMMLQQTRIATVLDGRYFERWMERFPDVKTLASATEEEVLPLWAGLGYYRRARFLHRAAVAVVTGHGGEFPQTRDSLRRLPGIGDYTSAAVAAFAFDAPEPVVDGNVARVLARLMDFDGEINTAPAMKILENWARQLVPARGGRLFNSALMELGQTHCGTGLPNCLLCPVRKFCAAKNPADLPRRKSGPAVTFMEENVAFFHREPHVALQRETGSRRHGLWKLPPWEMTAEGGAPLLEFRYSITRYRVTLRVFCPAEFPALGVPLVWQSTGDLPELALGAPYRKALVHLLPDLPW